LPAFLFLCCILSFLFRQLGKLSTLAMMMTRGSPHGKWFRVMRISIPGNTGDYFDLQLVVRHSEKDQLVRIQDGTYLKVVGRWQRESLNGIPYMISSKFTVTRPPRP